MNGGGFFHTFVVVAADAAAGILTLVLLNYVTVLRPSGLGPILVTHQPAHLDVLSSIKERRRNKN